jgi:hypothetical protein
VASLLAIAVLGIVFVEVHGAPLRAVALVCAACAFAGAGLGAATIRSGSSNGKPPARDQ